MAVYKTLSANNVQGLMGEPTRQQIITVQFVRCNEIRIVKIINIGTSRVAQWLGIHLPMQGTRVGALVREDPTCHRAMKPVHHNY